MDMDKKPISRGYGIYLCHQHNGRIVLMKELKLLDLI